MQANVAKKNVEDLTSPSKDKAKQTLAIAATYTIDSITPSLDYLSKVLSLDLNIELAPYHQVFQQLLDPASRLNKNHEGINLLAIRIEDFVRDLADSQDIVKKAKSIAQELEEALLQYSNNRKTSTILALLPASPRLPQPLSAEINTLTQTLENTVKGYPGIVAISKEDLDKTGFSLEEDYDHVSDDLAHVPFSESGFASTALSIARKLHLLKTPARKVLVLDCDNTIWGGVVGEDGVQGITLAPEFIAMQQFAIAMQSQGVLVCLASKNAEQDVMDVFAQRSDMVLKPEHIVSHRINWTSKYQNLESLATELNLGLDSFVFIDDNPVECGQMREMLPQVTTLQFPAASEVTGFLKHLWSFDKLAITEEDAKRTQMYRENSARQKLETSATDIGEFLSSLELVIDVGKPSDEEWARVAQLTQRTNQFNFTTIRRNEQDVKVLNETDNASVLRVKVSDRFGDYGLVGVMIAIKESQVLAVDTFLLSCRVLGRGVEHTMLRKLAEIAIETGCNTVKLPYNLTPKNEPARAFADSVMADFKAENSTGAIYTVPADTLQKTSYVPGSDPEAVLAAKAGKKKSTKPVKKDTTQSPSERYEKLTQIHHGEALITKMRTESIRQRDLVSEPIAPVTELEQDMLDLWQEVLGIQGLGVEDDFFALGGTSLLAARIFSEITHRFKATLRLTAILEAPTVRSLAELVKPSEHVITDQLITLKKGNKNTFFLIHDGDGETLLYRNLAAYLPDDMSVIGIEPYALPNMPMAHRSIEDMADFYVSKIKEKQEQGPYLLGGMCAGGLLAYVVADKLSKSGEKIEIVAILDAATPNARKHFAKTTKDRAKGLQQVFDDARNKNIVHKMLFIALNIIKKVWNVIHWEFSSRFASISKTIRFSMLKHVLSKHKPWPSWLTPLTVREVYNAAEEVCQLPETQLNAVLVRATKGIGDDIPYLEVYSDNDFGWGQYAKNLRIVDTEGGHASMLQEPAAQSLAKHILQNLNT